MFGRTLGRALTLATVLSLLMTSLAFGDELAINVASIVDDLENASGTRSVTAAVPSSGTTTFDVAYRLQVQGQGVDGQGGCNVGVGAPATMSFTGLPTGVSATGGTSWTQCNVSQDVTFTVTTSAVAGTYLNITPSLSGGLAGSYSYSEHTFRLILSAPTTPADTTAPSVSSIDRSGSNPTNAAAVSWTVTFSESVINVDATDFLLAATGVSGASITSVTGSGSTWTVTANTGSGDGPLGLNLVDNDSILDMAGNALGGTGLVNGDHTGQAYTVDKSGPSIVLTTDDTPSLTTSWFNIASDDDSDGIKLTATASDASGVASVTCTNNSAAFFSESDATMPASLSDTGTLANGANALSCTAVDGLGNTSAAVTGSYSVDLVSPGITDNGPTTAANADGWYNTNVTNTWTASDAHSGLPAGTNPISATTSGEGTAVTVNSGSVTDVAGNTTNGDESDEFQIDLTPPLIAASLDKVAAGTGWFNISTGAPTVSYLCSDALSGLAGTCPAPSLFGEGADQSATETVYDVAGNSASDGVSNIDVDLTPPTVTCASTPTFVLNQAGAMVSATVADGLAGPVSASVSGAANTALVNGGTVALTGRDNAGNETTVNCAFNIVSLTFNSPIDGGGTINIAKIGRVIPIKAAIIFNGSPLTDGPVYLAGLSQVSCTTGAPTDEVEMYAAAGSSNTGNQFRWDATAQRWMYNFDTSAFAMKAGFCYRINVYIGGTVSSTGVASGGTQIGYVLVKPMK